MRRDKIKTTPPSEITETPHPENKQFLTSILDSIRDGISVIDRNMEIIQTNRTIRHLYGHKGSLEGQKCYKTYHERTQACDNCPIIRAFESGKTEIGQIPFRQKDRRSRKLELYAFPMLDNAGRVLSVVEYIRDITRENPIGDKTAEAAREWQQTFDTINSEQLYKSMFKNNLSVMLLIDPETARIIDANPAACAFYGVSRETVTKMKISDINTLSEEQINREMNKAKSEHRNYFNFRHRTAEGIIKDVEVYSGPILVDSKQILCSIVHDISERKTFEKEREKLIHELQNALKEIKTLGGLLPICASCKKVRDDKGYWRRIESYIQKHSQAKFSHGLCPDCSDDLYGDKQWYIEMKQKKKT